MFAGSACNSQLTQVSRHAIVMVAFKSRGGCDEVEARLQVYGKHIVDVKGAMFLLPADRL